MTATAVLLPATVQADTPGGYIPRDGSEVVAVLSADVVALAAQVRRSAAAEYVPIPAASAATADRMQRMRELMAAYELALQDGSPRAYGHALALVEAWPGPGPQPVPVRVIKADILQHNHAFAAALDELAAVLEVDSGNLMALRMQPQVSLVAGHFDRVAAQCRQLGQAGYSALAMNCQAQLDGVTGQAEEALQRVEAALEAERLTRELAFELHVTAADLARRLNRPQLASGHFQTALKLNPASRFVVINIAGLMLEQGQAEEAASFLLSRQELANSLEMQVLHTVAMLESGHPEAALPHLAGLRAKVSAMQQRGTDQPYKLIASYAFHVAKDFVLAHHAARLNWKVQKDPSDTLLFAQTAAASGQRDSLLELARWRDRTGLQDSRLDAVLDEAGL